MNSTEFLFKFNGPVPVLNPIHQGLPVFSALKTLLGKTMGIKVPKNNYKFLSEKGYSPRKVSFLIRLLSSKQSCFRLLQKFLTFPVTEKGEEEKERLGRVVEGGKRKRGKGGKTLIV